jgi:hypothetical protein
LIATLTGGASGGASGGSNNVSTGSGNSSSAVSGGSSSASGSGSATASASGNASASASGGSSAVASGQAGNINELLRQITQQLQGLSTMVQGGGQQTGGSTAGMKDVHECVTKTSDTMQQVQAFASSDY